MPLHKPGMLLLMPHLPVDPVHLETYINLWVVKYGNDWTEIKDEMLLDKDTVEARMTRALAAANLLDTHYMADKMVFTAKLRKGV